MSIVNRIMAINEDLVAYHAIVKGEFEKEIARLELATKNFEAKIGVIKTLEEAHEAAAVIKGKVQGLLDEASDKAAKATLALAEIEKQKSLVQARENAARELELQVKSQWDELMLAKDAHDTHVSTTKEKLGSVQEALNKSAQAVAEQKAEVDAKAAKIASALKNL